MNSVKAYVKLLEKQRMERCAITNAGTQVATKTEKENTPAMLFLKAAETASRLEHCKDIYFRTNDKTGAIEGCCLLGAIMLAKMDIPLARKYREFNAQTVLENILGLHFVSVWNDKRETTKADVVDLLLTAAKKA